MLVTVVYTIVSLDLQIVIAERTDLGVDAPENIFRLWFLWFCSLKTSFSYCCDGKLQSDFVSLPLPR